MTSEHVINLLGGLALFIFGMTFRAYLTKEKLWEIATSPEALMKLCSDLLAEREKADSMADGVKLAEKVIDTGLAKAQLERFIKLSNA